MIVRQNDLRPPANRRSILLHMHVAHEGTGSEEIVDTVF